MNLDEPDFPFGGGLGHTASAGDRVNYSEAGGDLAPWPGAANVQPSRADRRAAARQSPEYSAFRAANRPFRRAFGRGEGHRKILLACGEANLKEKS